jgi:signal transduction histidine kinase
VEVLRDPVPVLPSLTDLGAPVRAAGIAVTFTEDGTQRPLPPTVEIAAYRTVQESLTNVVKHSGATEVTVHLGYGTDVLTVTIADNGHGAGKSVGGHGLIGMAERARAGGGRLHHSPDDGFTVTAELPTGER